MIEITDWRDATPEEIEIFMDDLARNKEKENENEH